MVRTQFIFTLAFLAGFAEFLAPTAFAQPQQKENTNLWGKAEAKIQTHLKGIDPKLSSGELKSAQLTKYLPEFRAFGCFNQNGLGMPRLLLVNQNAEITDLGDENWHGPAKAKYMRVPQVTEFLRARKIKIKTLEDAIEFVKFFEGLQSAPTYVTSLNVDTKDLTDFDKKFVEGQFSPSTDWKYTSDKQDQGWKVKVHFVGNPETSIMIPPIYELEVDEEGNFHDMKRFESLIRLLR